MTDKTLQALRNAFAYAYLSGHVDEADFEPVRQYLWDRVIEMNRRKLDEEVAVRKD